MVSEHPTIIDGDHHTRLAAPISNLSIGDRYPRKKTMTMGAVALMAVDATERALADARLLDHPVLRSGATGVSYGSSLGTPSSVVGFAELMTQGTSRSLTATSYIQMMSHTAPVNIGVFFGLTGRVITTSSACTSGSQGIGYAYEAIRNGKADVMVAGGAEELDVTMAAVFDTLFATSTRNDRPETTPRPFDRDRDGLVIGEGPPRWSWRSANTLWRAAPRSTARSWASPPIPTAVMSRSPAWRRWRARWRWRFKMPACRGRRSAS